jgi:hypothetical protein
MIPRDQSNVKNRRCECDRPAIKTPDWIISSRPNRQYQVDRALKKPLSLEIARFLQTIGAARCHGLFAPERSVVWLSHRGAVVNIDGAHVKWIIAVVVLAMLAAAAYVASPYESIGSSKSGLLFGVSGTALMGFAGLLPFGRKLAKWKIVRLQILQRGHIWLGLLSLPLILFHCGFHLGGRFSSALLILLGAITLSGVAGLLFQHLRPLCKEGQSGKRKTAAAIIAAGHRLTLLLHIPLAVALLVLVVFHAVMSLYF